MKLKIVAILISSFFILSLSPSALNDSKVYTAIQKSPKDNSKKIEYYSDLFLGVEYLESPLGEGQNGKYDNDPLYRFDKFDCVTFVETVLALSISENFSEFKKSLKNIRYSNDDLDFLSRNHFMTIDWIPDNSHMLKNITAEVGREHTEIFRVTIDKEGWFRETHNISLQKVDPSVARIDYVPMEKINYSRIPSGAIINIIRQDMKLKGKIGTDLAVFHTGFAIRKDGKLFFRNASSIYKKVVDEDFAEYFEKYKKDDGINILVLK